MQSKTVVLADGSFPVHKIPLGYLSEAERIICCDGATGNLLNAGFEPYAIVGDMDSLDEGIRERFADRIFKDDNQEDNDLTKAISWCFVQGYEDIVILGATGKREDHTIANISLLLEYIKDVKVIMVTDTGVIKPYLSSCKISTFPGQQISLFAIDTKTRLTTRGLRYPLVNRKIYSWWVASLNEAKGDSITVEFSQGSIIVYLKFPEDES
jgi:thiamine pyrophosphokinase